MNGSHQKQGASGRLVLPSLVISGFATKPARILVTLLLIEIAQTFGRSVGVTGQIQTTSSIVEIITIAYTNLPSLWLALSAAHLGSFFGDLMYTAANSLVLEQVPGFRGTMMSINAAANGMGVALGSAVGGVALQWFGWGILGISPGMLGLVAAVIYALLAVDPTQT